MISRDIDLTENLDFKRDTKERNKKSYELIPWNKRNKNIEDKKNNLSSTYTLFSVFSSSLSRKAPNKIGSFSLLSFATFFACLSV